MRIGNVGLTATSIVAFTAGTATAGPSCCGTASCDGEVAADFVGPVVEVIAANAASEASSCCGSASCGSESSGVVSTAAAQTNSGGLWCCGSSECSGDHSTMTVANVSDADLDPAVLEAYTGFVAEHIAKSTFAALPDDRREQLLRMIDSHLAAQDAELGWASVATCFQEGTDWRVVEAFQAALDGLYPGRFQTNPGQRWSNVASGPAGSFGKPVTLTWSFVPDGTSIPSGVGEPAGISNLFARMNSFYGGNTAAWQAIYFECFERWGDITGINYVFEPNDDGADLFGAAGVPGVRGDMRMAGKTIDGNSGTLAYNFFPNTGDMVIDTADSNFYGNTSSNSVRLFNVLMHEHGHGMGLFHVCPVDNNILMEPFINLNFQGAQHDDIRGAHFLYGDFYEPNDTTAQATDLGTLSIGQSINRGNLPPNGRQTVDFGSRLSINNNDFDVFEFQVQEPASLNVSASPVGETYLDNPQNSNCTGSNTVNSLLEANLRVEVLNASGSVIASSNSGGNGQVEFLNDVELDTAGTYFIRVCGAPLTQEVQLYDLDLDIDNPGFLGLTIAAITPIPDEVDPGVITPITLTIDPRQDTLIGGSETLFVRTDGGSYQAVPLVPTGQPNEYVANLPAFLCVDSPEFFVSAEATVSGEVTLPFEGAGAPFSALVGTEIIFINLNFQVSGGWAPAGGTAGDGQWDLGVPVDNDRGDPPADFDGSGRAWLTDNTAATDNSDVDDGTTILLSPIYDISNGATINWAYWLNDVANGQLSPEDRLTVEFSFNGGSTWTTVRDYGTAAPEWRTDSVDVTPAQGTDQFRIRVTVGDLGNQNVVEAGFDAFRINRIDCVDPDPNACPEDVTGDDTVDLADLLAVLADFGTSGSLPTDVDGNGDVDLADLLAVLAEFGNDCP